MSQENTYQDSLKEQVELGQEQLEEKQALQKKQWLQVNEFYKKNRPKLHDKQRMFQGISVPLSIEPFSHAEIETVSHQVGQEIATQLGKAK